MTKSKSVNTSKRDLLKVAASVPVAASLVACGGSGSSSSSSSSQPNVLFILVDQMRYPVHLPSGTNTADEFIQKFMPNLYTLWQKGVKFANHQITATACGPSRATLVTGLYTQQTWNAATYAPILGNTPPELSSEMPTYGKLFQAAGYDTPYMGKWHLSEPWITGMARYGFEGITEQYQLDAANLQGTYSDANYVNPTTGEKIPYYNDEFIADYAVNWLKNKKTTDRPWCLTVGLQNPHDYQFFPTGTEFVTFTNLFADPTYNQRQSIQAAPYSKQPSATGVNWSTNVFNKINVQSYGYPAIPSNWETKASLNQNKPKWQVVVRQWNGMQFGVVAEQANIASYDVRPYPFSPEITYSGYSNTIPGYGPATLGMGIAPYTYWQRGMAAYTLAMEIVDKSIGRVLNAIPADVANNTVIVFTSDHGEQAGSHGFISNKSGEVYAETVRVPLIVSDPTGKFAGDVATERSQITSAVDLVAMMVSFAYGGTRSWMTGDNAILYEKRFDMFPLLKSASAKGRDYALFSTDETIDLWQDFATAPNSVNNKTAGHVLGLITQDSKLTVYSNWTPGTVDIANDGRQEGEYYDISTPTGKLELDNLYASSGSAAKVAAMKALLLNDLVPNEMRAPLPESLRAAQEAAKQQLINYYLSQQS